MAAPTFVAEAESVWNTTTSPKTVSITVDNGDVVVVCAGTDATGGLGSPSGGGLTYTLQQADGVVAVVVHTTIGTSTQTFTLSQPDPGGADFGVNALRFAATAGVGASTVATVSGVDGSVSLTTQADNSAVVVLIVDFGAVDGAARTWKTVNGITPTVGNGLEATYNLDAGIYTVYAAYYSDAGAAGANTFGISAPTGGNYSVIAVEVKGIATVASTVKGRPAWRTPPWQTPGLHVAFRPTPRWETATAEGNPDIVGPPPRRRIYPPILRRARAITLVPVPLMVTPVLPIPAVRPRRQPTPRVKRGRRSVAPPDTASPLTARPTRRIVLPRMSWPRGRRLVTIPPVSPPPLPVMARRTPIRPMWSRHARPALIVTTPPPPPPVPPPLPPVAVRRRACIPLPRPVRRRVLPPAPPTAPPVTGPLSAPRPRPRPLPPRRTARPATPPQAPPVMASPTTRHRQLPPRRARPHVIPINPPPSPPAPPVNSPRYPRRLFAHRRARTGWLPLVGANPVLVVPADLSGVDGSRWPLSGVDLAGVVMAGTPVASSTMDSTGDRRTWEVG